MLLSMLAGAAVFVYTSDLFPVLEENSSGSMLVGAGAFAFALMMYMFVHMPDHTFVYMMLVRLKIRYVVLGIVVVDLLSYSSAAPGIHLSHLAGAIFGGGFALLNKANQQKRLLKPRMKVTRTSKSKKKEDQTIRTKTDEEYNFIKKQKQEKLDAILDKISKYGYGSLTEDEKSFLFYESKR